MAALPSAGVNLEAKGFDQYIKNLTEIDKKQRQVFDQKFKGTGLSYQQVTNEAKKYEAELKKVQKEESKIGKGGGLSAAAGGILAFATGQTVAVVAESAKAAAAFEGQRVAINNLAAQYGQSGNEIINAITRAANGTVSASQAMQAANQGILLGVAQTPEQFEVITDAALKLGRTLGLTAPQAIEQFTTALGRKSLLILDNFGISAKQVNAEIDRLAQGKFGVPAAQLDQAAKDALFMEAALKIAGEAAATIGDEAGKANANFDRLNAQTENLKVAFGQAILPLVGGLSGLLADAAVTAQQLLSFISAGIAGIGSTIGQLGSNIKEAFSGQRGLSDLFDIDFQEAGNKATEAFKRVARVQGISFPGDEVKSQVDTATQALADQEEQVKLSEDAIKQYEQALQQAESLQLSFARQAEDAARKLAREQAKLAQSQSKEINDLYVNQQKDLDNFESDRLNQIAKAEKDIQKQQQDSGKEQIKQQKNLQRELAQAQDKFNLDRLQSQRRFDLDQRRLVAEGDILGLQQLREDFELQKQENKENFNLSQSQRKEDTKDQIAEQQRQTQERQAELQQKLNDLKTSLETERAELLTSFDTQEQELRAKQLEQQQQLQQSYAEQQEDARINQQRQLEDLGRSLARQKDVTGEGVQAISTEIEKIFGQEGVADQIFGGFTTRTESEFTDLFANIEQIITKAEKKIQASTMVGANFGADIAAASSLGVGRSSSKLPLYLPGFDDGGIVPGPRGSPQAILAHGGETVLPTHKINNPVIPSQVLNVVMSGGFNISGGEAAGGEAVQAAINQTVEMFEIAIDRIAKR